MPMRNKIILLITHLISAIFCGATFVWSILNSLEIGFIILIGIATTCWLGCAIIDFVELVEMMEPVFLRCPKCNKKIMYNNWFVWLFYSPIHWFGSRYTKCHCCGKWSYMKRIKK